MNVTLGTTGISGTLINTTVNNQHIAGNSGYIINNNNSDDVITISKRNKK